MVFVTTKEKTKITTVTLECEKTKDTKSKEGINENNCRVAPADTTNVMQTNEANDGSLQTLKKEILETTKDVLDGFETTIAKVGPYIGK